MAVGSERVELVVADELLPLAFPALAAAGTAPRFWYVLASTLASGLAALLVPLTIVIAILRAGFLDIDLVINRTLTYFATTALLADTFAALSSATQFVLGQRTGHGCDAASIVIALAVGLTFGPLKAYLQAVVDRTLRPPAYTASVRGLPRGDQTRHQ